MNKRYLKTRSEMLSLLPLGGKIAEVGVFAGDFSAEILQISKPAELILIDLWSNSEICSGDSDGNNIRYFNGNELEKIVRGKFRNSSIVKICKGSSKQIEAFPSDYFDAVYLDGDHSYEGVKTDLINSWKVLKDGGWLMGHDYETNADKTQSSYNFGVKRAVDEFCWEYDEHITCFAMDGQVSFGIQVHKKGSLLSGYPFRVIKHTTRVFKRFFIPKN
jgi:hypothetical protein